MEEYIPLTVLSILRRGTNVTVSCCQFAPGWTTQASGLRQYLGHVTSTNIGSQRAGKAGGGTRAGAALSVGALDSEGAFSHKQPDMDLTQLSPVDF